MEPAEKDKGLRKTQISTNPDISNQISHGQGSQLGKADVESLLNLHQNKVQRKMQPKLEMVGINSYMSCRTITHLRSLVRDHQFIIGRESIQLSATLQ